MSIKKLTDALGITKYPERIEKFYDETDLYSPAFIDMDMLLEYQEKYDICGEYIDTVIAGGEAILKNKNVLAWGNIALKYLSECTEREQARALVMPDLDGTLERDMLPVYVLLKQLPKSAKLYRELGFSEEETKRVFGVIKGSMKIGVGESGRPTIRQPYYSWAYHYLYATILDYGSLSFERHFDTKLPVFILKNRQDGRIVVLADGARVHKSGGILGSSGCEDENGSFTAELTVTDDEYIGYPATDDAKFSGEKIALKKAEWEVIFKCGDYMVSIHIPRRADFSDEALDKTFAGGKALLEKHFPGEKNSVTMCISWLMDPMLEDMLGPESKLVKFGKRYVRFPYLSSGHGFFCFIYPDSFTKPIEELPENTTLQRKVKQLYLDGGNLHAVGGILIE